MGRLSSRSAGGVPVCLLRYGGAGAIPWAGDGAAAGVGDSLGEVRWGGWALCGE